MTPDEKKTLFELLDAVREDRMTDEQFARLRQLMHHNAEAEELYVEYMVFCADLKKRLTSFPEDMLRLPLEPDDKHDSSVQRDLQQESQPDYKTQQAQLDAKLRMDQIKQQAEESLLESRREEQRREEERLYREYLTRRRQFIVGITSLAALVAIMVFIWFAPPPASEDPVSPVMPDQPRPRLVASVVDSQDALWNQGHPVAPAETRLAVGPMTLEQGLLSIRFDAGADALLQAPCEFVLESEGQMSLLSGAASFVVPPSAVGFVVQTPTGIITDYGTEFAVLTRKNGETETQVYQGKVSVKSVHAISEPEKMLALNQAAIVDRSGHIHETPFASNRFIREISDRPGFGIPGKRLNLADVVGNGNGFQTGHLGGAIDIITTNFVKTPYGADGYSLDRLSKPLTDHDYKLLPQFNYIDGVFLPVSTQGSVEISSEGHRFDLRQEPANGEDLRYIGNWATTGRPSDTAGAMLNGQEYGTLENPAMMMKQNKGVTFDLDAIRADLPDAKILRFTALCGLPETDRIHCKQGKADFYVLVDGDTGFHSAGMTPFMPAASIDIALKDTDRFLTLMTAYSGAAANHSLFAVPALHMVTKEKP